MRIILVVAALHLVGCKQRQSDAALQSDSTAPLAAGVGADRELELALLEVAAATEDLAGDVGVVTFVSSSESPSAALAGDDSLELVDLRAQLLQLKSELSAMDRSAALSYERLHAALDRAASLEKRVAPSGNDSVQLQVVKKSLAVTLRRLETLKAETGTEASHVVVWVKPDRNLYDVYDLITRDAGTTDIGRSSDQEHFVRTRLKPGHFHRFLRAFKHHVVATFYRDDFFKYGFNLMVAYRMSIDAAKPGCELAGVFGAADEVAARLNLNGKLDDLGKLAERQFRMTQVYKGETEIYVWAMHQADLRRDFLPHLGAKAACVKAVEPALKDPKGR